MRGTSPLARRVARLERAVPIDHVQAWRGYLAPYFAGPEYDEHRQAIIDALCSDSPQYLFSGPAPDYPEGHAGYVVSWWTRERGDPPLVRIYPGRWFDAI